MATEKKKNTETFQFDLLSYLSSELSKQIFLYLQFQYDFSLENKIIAKAEREKERQLQLLKKKKEEEEEAALKTQDQANKSGASVSTTTPISIFSNVGTDILQPIAVSSTGHKRNDSLGKNTFDLSDFEANGTNPFELVEMQTINDLDVLKSVLEPVSNSKETSGSVAVASAGVSTNVTPTFAMGSMVYPSNLSNSFSYLSNQTPIPSTSQGNHSKLNSRLSKSVPDLCNDQLVDISSDETHKQLVPDVAASTSRSVSPPSSAHAPSQPNAGVSMGYGMPTQPFNYLQGGLPTNRPTSGQVLVDVNSRSTAPITESITPLNLRSSLSNNTQISNPLVGTTTSVTSSNNRLPPLRKAPPIPPRLMTGRKNINNVERIATSFQGMTVTDGAPSCAPLTTPATCSQDTPRNTGSYMVRSFPGFCVVMVF